jgi:SAM-dependent methyltransferase
LIDLASLVVGADASAGMLAEAPRLPGIAYAQSAAEQLPFADAAFELVTVSSAFHWFERERFLPEARRVLRPRGALVVYTTGFSGTMRENPDFARWQREVYRGRYPGTRRHGRPLSDDDVTRAGFARIEREEAGYDVSFTADELASWFTTHSNIIAAIDRGDDTLDGTLSWLVAELTPLFPAPRCTFPFETTITYAWKE